MFDNTSGIGIVIEKKNDLVVEVGIDDGDGIAKNDIIRGDGTADIDFKNFVVGHEGRNACTIFDGMARRECEIASAEEIVTSGARSLTLRKESIKTIDSKSEAPNGNGRIHIAPRLFNSGDQGDKFIVIRKRNNDGIIGLGTRENDELGEGSKRFKDVTKEKSVKFARIHMTGDGAEDRGGCDRGTVVRENVKRNMIGMKRNGNGLISVIDKRQDVIQGKYERLAIENGADVRGRMIIDNFVSWREREGMSNRKYRAVIEGNPNEVSEELEGDAPGLRSKSPKKKKSVFMQEELEVRAVI